jgi:hypothetical protein
MTPHACAGPCAYGTCRAPGTMLGCGGCCGCLGGCAVEYEESLAAAVVGADPKGQEGAQRQ